MRTSQTSHWHHGEEDCPFLWCFAIPACFWPMVDLAQCSAIGKLDGDNCLAAVINRTRIALRRC